LCYIIVISLSALDFWTVKNVSGRYDQLLIYSFYYRILVGLRWWSRVRNDGKEEWHYESLEKSKIFNYNVIKYDF